MIKDLVTVDGKVKRNASPSFGCPTMACELADFAAVCCNVSLLAS